jgi:hypothetical protein
MVLNLPLDEWIDNTHKKTQEKRKGKETNRKTPTIDRKPNKGKEQVHLKKTSIGPPRQGQRLDTSETKQSTSKESKPPIKARKPQRAPLHTSKLPLNQCNSP